MRLGPPIPISRAGESAFGWNTSSVFLCVQGQPYKRRSGLFGRFGSNQGHETFGVMEMFLFLIMVIVSYRYRHTCILYRETYILYICI